MPRSRSDEAADDAGEDQQQRQVGALPDQHRAQEVVERAHEQLSRRAETVPHRLSPVQYSQIVAGRSTSIGPSWARQSTKHGGGQDAGEGNPATARPTPPSSAWTSAVTTTPSATPRIAPGGEQHDVLAALAREPSAELAHAGSGRSPPEYITAAMMIVSRNCTTKKPDAAGLGREPSQALPT